MEQRLANSWQMTINEKTFIEEALLSDLRVDGRRLLDYRHLSIKFGREDGSSEIQLGQTLVMGFVTSQIVQPYRDRPNEGTLSIFTEFSPMADPSFEAGRPGESAVELGRVVDRGLRESRAIDMESLCLVAGKFVWAVRVDLHILDNGGNLIDAANIAALAALLTFRRPECSVGEDGQDITVHPLEIREPLPLTIHHLPVAITFAFFNEGNIVVIDPTYKEEAVMGGRMTVTMNLSGEVCSVQKAGHEGVAIGIIMHCFRVASIKAADITSKIKNAVETYSTERALSKIKRHSSSDGISDVEVPASLWTNSQKAEKPSNVVSAETKKPKKKLNRNNGGNTTKAFVGAPSNWDPYSDTTQSYIRSSQAVPGTSIFLILFNINFLTWLNLQSVMFICSAICDDNILCTLFCCSKAGMAHDFKLLLCFQVFSFEVVIPRTYPMILEVAGPSMVTIDAQISNDLIVEQKTSATRPSSSTEQQKSSAKTLKDAVKANRRKNRKST